MLQSQRERSHPEIARGWTSGHYSPMENVSRMFVPDDDELSIRLIDVYTHELAHHWLATRAPILRKSNSGVSAQEMESYWIVEGFATLIEEFRMNPDLGTWDPVNPRARSLDTVANANELQLIPWEQFFRLSKLDFMRLTNTKDRAISLSWKLGSQVAKSEIQMFYAQAGAVCHYLFRGAEGTHREALVRFWSDWYGRKANIDGVRSTFGIGPKALGDAVVAFARQTVNSN